MNRSIVVLAGTTLAFGSASAYFWQAQRAANERGTALESRIEELETKLAAAQPLPPVPLAQTPFTAPPPQDAEPAPRKPVRAPSVSNGPKVAGTIPPALHRGFGQPAPVFRSMRMDKLMEDPEYREAMRSQHRMSMSSRYPDIGEALNLQPDQVDKLMDLLTDQEIAGMSRTQPPFSQDGRAPDPTAMQEWGKQMQKQQRDNEAQIAALLGDAGVQEWKDYQQTLGARMQVKQLRSVMEGSSDPIRSDQMQPLVAAMAAEQRRAMESQMQNLRNNMGQRPALVGSQIQMTSGNRVAMIEQSLEQTVQNHERMRDAVAPYLSPRQLEHFDKYQKQQLDMQHASLRMMKLQAEAEARGDVPGDGTGTSMAVSGVFVPATP
jgi:hypothetical protein